MEKKIESYEAFVNEKLRLDLAKVLKEQELIYTDIAEYLQLKDFIENTQLAKNSPEGLSEPFRTRVDLGCNFYAKAQIDDMSKIYIAIGYGFHLEMTFSEALRFIEKKTSILQQSADELNDKANEIKANIKFVIEGLKEIQNLDLKEDKAKVVF